MTSSTGPAGQNAPGTLLIRADASAGAGTGHVMRCLALAQYWARSGAKAVFAAAACTPALEERLARDGFEVVPIAAQAGTPADAEETVRLARAREAAWVVADGYHFDADWQKIVKRAGRCLALFDDYGHATEYHADLVVNQNLGTMPEVYRRREASTRLLLGSRYVQLRREFLEWRPSRTSAREGGMRVLIVSGGSDAGNVTVKALRGLAQIPSVEALVIVGGSSPHREALRAVVAQAGVSARQLVDPPNLVELMDWADVAVSSAGTTAWELAYLGLPTVLLTVAPNQRPVAEGLARECAALSLGEASQVTVEEIADAIRELLSDAARRQAMAQRARQLVDGLGTPRVATRMRAAELAMRRATEQDCRTIWEWANQPAVRMASFKSRPLDWDSHVQWYAARLQDPCCRFYIGSDGNGRDVGQVRFQAAKNEAVLSVSLGPEGFGRGLGAALIVRGVDEFLGESEAGVVHAYVKADNPNSLKAFEKADFEDQGETEVQCSRARHYIRRRLSA